MKIGGDMIRKVGPLTIGVIFYERGINTYKMIPNMMGYGKTFLTDYKGYPTKNKNQIHDLITGQNEPIFTQYLHFGPLPNLFG